MAAKEEPVGGFPDTQLQCQLVTTGTIVNAQFHILHATFEHQLSSAHRAPQWIGVGVCVGVWCGGATVGFVLQFTVHCMGANLSKAVRGVAGMCATMVWLTPSNPLGRGESR